MDNKRKLLWREPCTITYNGLSKSGFITEHPIGDFYRNKKGDLVGKEIKILRRFETNDTFEDFPMFCTISVSTENTKEYDDVFCKVYRSDDGKFIVER